MQKGYNGKARRLVYSRKLPGNTEVVSMYTTSLDRPNTSVTTHSHFKQRPISSNRTLYEQELLLGNGSYEKLSPTSDEQNLQ